MSEKSEPQKRTKDLLFSKLGQQKSKNINNILCSNKDIYINKDLKAPKVHKIGIQIKLIQIIKLYLIFSSLDAEFNQRKYLVNSSYIILKNKGKSNDILYYSFYPKPDIIFVNGNTEEYNFYNYKIASGSGINTYKLVWNEELNDTSSMFYRYCTDIVEIDLSNFDSSQVTDMSLMFWICSSLTSLNLNNFKTSKTTKMIKMFESCSSLKSLDLSSFDTSQCINMVEMFSSCSSLKTLDLSNFNTSQVVDMRGIFSGCKNLSSLIISNFDTSKVTDMGEMFQYCSSLSSLDLSNLDTSKVQSMRFMFYQCSSLSSLNISNFNTTQIIYMKSMFEDCSLLSSLNLSNFNTPKVIDMSNMFENCSLLSSLDLSNFDTSQVTDMRRMFFNCSLLKQLDLPNSDTPQLIEMDYMFTNCSSLSSLNLYNFNTTKVLRLNGLFENCSSLVSLDLSSFETSQIKGMSSMFKGCSSLSQLYLTSFNTSRIGSMDKMFYNCSSLISLNLSNFDISKLTYKNSMNQIFYNCSNLEYINFKIAKMNENINKSTLFFSELPNLLISSEYDEWKDCFNITRNIYCNKENLKFKIFMNNALSLNSNYTCEICGIKFYKKYNDSNNNDSYINCYGEPEGYYLDEDEYLYKPCYSTCKTCNRGGNESEHNCIECKDDYFFEKQISNFNNCYNYTSSTSLNNIINNILVTTIYNIIIPNTSYSTISNFINDNKENTYYQNLTDDINYLTNDIFTYKRIDDFTYKNIDDITYKNSEVSTYTNIQAINRTELIQKIIYNLLNQINLKEDENNFNKTIVDEELTIIFSSTLNQKINENNYDIIVKLGQCENILKKEYKIPNNDSLYILQFIYEEEGMKIPKVEYEVYYQLFNISNLTKLDLNLCQGTKAEIIIPVKLDEDIDKHNASSGYYNDLCYKTTSESGTDISLKDRRNEFVDNNMTLCEEYCELIDYDYTKEKAICSCDIKVNITSNYDVKFDKKDFFKSFIKINNIANLSVLKCYKVVLRIKSLIKNYGFYIIAFILILYFITLFIFWCKSFIILKNDIRKMISSLQIIKLVRGDNKINKKDKEDKIYKKKNRRQKV